MAGGAILQNILQRDLPVAYLATLPQGAQIAYAVIPQISGLAPALRTRVRIAFAHATRTMWLVMLGLAGAGLLSCLLMREEKMREALDEQWGLQDKKSAEKGSLEGAQKDVESAGSGGPVRGGTREVPPRVE